MESEFDALLDDEVRSDLLREIRAVTAHRGVSDGQAGSLEWRVEDKLGGRYVTISPTSAGTRLEVSGNFMNAARSAAGLGAVVAGAGAVAVVAAVSAVGALGWLVAPIVAIGTVAIPRLTVGRIVGRESRKISQLATRLGSMLASRPARDDTERDV